MQLKELTAVSVNRGNTDQDTEGGIIILSSGAVTLVDVNARENRADGLYEESASGNVIVRSSRNNLVFYYTGNWISGMDIIANGAFIVSNINARWNSGIDPDDYSKIETSGYGLLIDNTSALTRVAVTITNSSFESNHNFSLVTEKPYL